MINLYLTRGNDFGSVCLRLPASPAEEGEVFAQLDEYSTDVRSTQITAVTSPIPNLARYIKSADVNGPDYGKLKQLAEQLAGMTERERYIFSGALDAESVNGLDDVLHIACRLERYELIEDVTCDRELGGYLVEHDLLGVDFLDTVRPYLDYVAIGAAYYSNHGGAYTLNGYVKQKEPAPILENKKNNIFELHMNAANRDNDVLLSLPANESDLEAAKHRLQIEDFCEAKILGLDSSIPYLIDFLPLDCISVEDANDLAAAVNETLQEDGMLMKYLSVLTIERPETFTQAYHLALELDDYERVPADTEEYGRMVLRRIGADQELLDTIDGYMDFEKLGEGAMAEDGVRQTEFGFIRRYSHPFDSPNTGGMRMG